MLKITLKYILIKMKDTMKKILFTGGGGAATEFLWRNLKGKYELFFADADIKAIDDRIPLINKVEIPFANESNFVEKLSEIVTALSIDILVPSVDEELVVIGNNIDSFTSEVLLPKVAFVSSMLDKFESMKLIASKELAHPTTKLVKYSESIGYPQIVKPRNGRGSRGVSILNSIEEVDAYMVINRVNHEDIISQELAFGTEYTVLIAADNKANLKAIVPVRIEQKKGITIRAETEIQNTVIQYCKDFQDKFKVTGVYNLQCILTNDGKVIPFEINPRISTTFCLGIASGFDPFESLYGDDNEDVFYPHTTYSLKRNWHNNIEKDTSL